MGDGVYPNVEAIDSWFLCDHAQVSNATLLFKKNLHFKFHNIKIVWI